MKYIWYAYIDGEFSTGSFEDSRNLDDDFDGLYATALELARDRGKVDENSLRVRLGEFKNP